MASRATKKWRHRRQGINHELKSKLMSIGVVGAEISISWETTRQEKMSKVLLDFVAPYIATSNSHGELEKVVLLGLIAWKPRCSPQTCAKDRSTVCVPKQYPPTRLPTSEKSLMK